ncbi:hypothetical protein FRC09_000246 [Ceratobasidium sp. 395]|nr:hypothetical protein FRC09_000246 [Ceratobasidium sp. 395]
MDARAKLIFVKLKPVCTELLRQSSITLSTASQTSSTLATLVSVLRDAPPSDLTPALIEYTFFPLSHLLRRNPIRTLPNHIVEQVFLVLSLLSEQWYWTCDPPVWEQLVILATSVLAGLDTPDETKRDEETFIAAVQTLRALIRAPPLTPTSPDLESNVSQNTADAQSRFTALASHISLPILGKSLDALLTHVHSPNSTLQSTSLDVLLVLVRDYFPEQHIPTILPGVVSTMCRVALSATRGAAIASSLDILTAAIVRGLNDETCIQSGALRNIQSLDDFLPRSPSPLEPPSTTTPETDPHTTLRTPSWLTATSAQTHIALNTLTPLLTHPNPTARTAFVKLCTSILQTTPRSLAQSQTLLLGHLLVLAYPALPLPNPNSKPPTPEDSKLALTSLQTLLPTLTSPLSTLTSRALSTLPHRLANHTQSASLLARQLTTSSTLSPSFASSLLGPSGGIDKWGITLLHSIKLVSPSVVVLADPARLIEPGGGSDEQGVYEEIGYPRLQLRDADVETHTYIEEMFTAMGCAAGEGGMYAVEWFVGVGIAGVGERQVAAMWCALTILRGAVNSNGGAKGTSGKMAKTARWIGRAVADLWDDATTSSTSDIPGAGARAGAGETKEDTGQTLDLVQTEHIKGLNPLTTLLDRPSPSSSSSSYTNKKRTHDLQTQHTSLALHLLATSHSVLSNNPTSITLLQHTLYPLLQGLLSPVGLVNMTAHAALSETAHALGYASPPNMLLANFDYALESVSSRLASFSMYAHAQISVPLASQSQPHTSIPSLSIQALQVLRALIRLIGRAIIDRAYDVLDECFDRLDDYHGYAVVVQALVDVLAEVVDAVGREDEGTARDEEREEVVGEVEEEKGEERWDEFVKWFKERHIKKLEKWEFDPDEPDPELEPTNEETQQQENSFEPAPLSPTQSLTRTIIARATYFLTHPSPHIRARILTLLTTAAPTLRASALLPTIHASWPFILNRLEDKEMWVVARTCELVEVLSRHVGDFMARRVWDDVWPRFEKMLKAQAHTALTRTTAQRKPYPSRPNTMDDLGPLALGRLHLSILHTLTSAAAHVDPRDDALWNVLLACRRFLRKEEREDVQAAAREMYVCVAKRNADAVWLVLSGMDGKGGEGVKMPGFLKVEGWDVRENVELVLNAID